MFASIIRIMLQEFMRQIVKTVAMRTGGELVHITGEYIAKNMVDAFFHATYKEINDCVKLAMKKGIDYIKQIPYNKLYDIANPKRILQRSLAKAHLNSLSHVINNGKKAYETYEDYTQFLKDKFTYEFSDLKEFDSYITDQIQEYDITGGANIAPWGQRARNIDLDGEQYTRQGKYFVKKEDLEKYKREMREYNQAIKNYQSSERKLKERLKRKVVPKKIRDINKWTSQKEWTDYLEKLEYNLEKFSPHHKYESQKQYEDAMARKQWYEFFGTNKGYSKSAYKNLLKEVISKRGGINE